jgi:hypothetical protein
MDVHVSYKLHKTPDIEKEVSHQIEKLRKRIQVFRPDLVRLKAVIDDSSARTTPLIPPLRSKQPLTNSSNRSAATKSFCVPATNGVAGAEDRRNRPSPVFPSSRR